MGNSCGAAVIHPGIQAWWRLTGVAQVGSVAGPGQPARRSGSGYVVDAGSGPAGAESGQTAERADDAALLDAPICSVCGYCPPVPVPDRCPCCGAERAKFRPLV